MELDFDPPRVTGQEASTGTVSVSSPVPLNYLVSLVSAIPTTAYVPPQVLIPDGKTSVTFRVFSSPVPADTSIKITATAPHGMSSSSKDLDVLAPVVSAVVITPDSVLGGIEATGTVTLNGPAPADFHVAISTSRPSVVIVPVSVTVAAGQTAASFPVRTLPVGLPQSVAIIASTPSGDATVGAEATIEVNPPTVTAFLLPADAKGGTSIDGAFALSGAAPTDFVVSFQSTVANAASATPVTVPAGQNQAAVSVDVHTVAVTTTTVLSAVTPAGTSKDAAPLAILPVEVTSLTFVPTTIRGDQTALGTLRLDSPAPEGYRVSLLSGDPSHIVVPDSVTFVTGATSASFNVDAKWSNSPKQVTITATTPSGVVTNAPINLAPVAITGITFNPSNVWPGDDSTGTVILNGKAAGDFLIQLSSDKPNIVDVPPSVTVKAGDNSGTFIANAVSFTGNRSAMITGEDLNHARASAVLRVG